MVECRSRAWREFDLLLLEPLLTGNLTAGVLPWVPAARVASSANAKGPLLDEILRIFRSSRESVAIDPAQLPMVLPGELADSCSVFAWGAELDMVRQLCLSCASVPSLHHNLENICASYSQVHASVILFVGLLPFIVLLLLLLKLP